MVCHGSNVFGKMPDSLDVNVITDNINTCSGERALFWIVYDAVNRKPLKKGNQTFSVLVTVWAGYQDNLNVDAAAWYTTTELANELHKPLRCNFEN